jgi:hypothetical protein
MFVRDFRPRLCEPAHTGDATVASILMAASQR